MIDTTTVLITTAASYRTVCTSAQGRGGEGREWKILEKFNRSPVLTPLATHFARLRSRYRLIDDYNNDRLLYIHRAPPPLPFGSISLETDRIAVRTVARHYSNLVTRLFGILYIYTNSSTKLQLVAIHSETFHSTRSFSLIIYEKNKS